MVLRNGGTITQIEQQKSHKENSVLWKQNSTDHKSKQLNDTVKH